MPDPLVISVILNTNRREDTLECLASLSRSSYQNHRIIVLDNHSTDGSVEVIREKYPQVEIIAIEENLGYAGNNNVGLERAVACGADWVFVLNEDTIIDPECIAYLVKAAEKDPSIGVVGPLVYHFSEPDFIQTAGGILTCSWDSRHISQDEKDIGQIKGVNSVDFISGCGILVKRAVIDQVGMIDARFFYYKEETEWCLRIRNHGWKVIIEPKAKMWHKGVTRNHQIKPHVAYYRTRNQLLMISKHHAPIYIWLLAFGQIFRTIISWTIKPKWKHMRAHRNHMWKGVLDFIFQRWGIIQ